MSERVTLSRQVRFVAPICGRTPDLESTTGRNTFAAWPAQDDLGIFVDLEVACLGEPDGTSGYLVNIRQIDDATRAIATTTIARALRSGDTAVPPVARSILDALRDGPHALAPIDVVSVRWRVTPTYHCTVTAASPDSFTLSQHFDFAAAHHLSAPSLDDDANRALYGACQRPHGHNYRLEVHVRAPFEPADGTPTFTLAALEEAVATTIMPVFDHRDLNAEVPEFTDAPPTVEWIARACFQRLEATIAAAGGTLSHVRVWETEKTSCCYPAP